MGLRVCGRLVVVGEMRPKGRPGRGWPAQKEGQALLVVVESDAVVDGRHPATPCEVGGRVGGTVVADYQSMGVVGGRGAPLAEAVVAAVGAGQPV